MIRSWRWVGLGSATRASVSYAVPGLRVSVVSSTDLVFDPSVLRGWRWPSPGEPRSHAHISLPIDGHFLSRRAGEHDVRPGEAIVETDFTWAERWDGGRFRLLVIEWGDSYGERPGTGGIGLAPRDAAHLVSTADAIEAGGEQARRSIVAFGARLRSIGVPLAAWDERVLATVDPDVQQTAALVSRFESSLAAQPMWVDAETSERQGRRRVSRLEQALGSHALGLRGRLARARITAAAALLGARDAPIEHVARAVGYGTARALSRALHEAGLGSASALRLSIAR